MINDMLDNIIFDRNTYSPLLLADVIPLIPPVPPETDSKTAESLFAFRRDIYQRRVFKVNENLFDFSNLWPNGRPIDFFIALELSNDDLNLALANLKDQNFIRTVLSECAARGIAHVSSRRRKIGSIYSNFADHNEMVNYADGDNDDDEDEDDDDEKWSTYEIEKLKSLVKRFGKKFSSISKQLKGKSPKSCKEMYEQIKLQESMKKKKKKLNINSVTLIKDNVRYTAGQGQTKYNEMEFMNPIPGCIDPLTCKPMSIPAISPDGYVMDYETWIKLLNEKKVNPFTQNPIKSKRELVILTIDNYEEYKDKIVNFEEIQP